MKITIEYDGIEEIAEATDAINVGALSSFIWNFEKALRGKRKYREWKTEEAKGLIEALWEEWRDLKADLPKGEE